MLWWLVNYINKIKSAYFLYAVCTYDVFVENVIDAAFLVVEAVALAPLFINLMNA